MNDQNRFITYSTGHGGDGYMKMQDTSYLLDFEMAKIVKEMHHLKMLIYCSIVPDTKRPSSSQIVVALSLCTKNWTPPIFLPLDLVPLMKNPTLMVKIAHY